tara:strand:+ start:296 stop:706 length:411 start_codon:yes stop_codon:yes gene_type:complete
MKIIKFILILITFNIYSQEVPSDQWITDNNFESKANGKNAFGDDEEVVVIEFWAEFNKDNAFSEWSKLNGCAYYRVNIADAPAAKKKYRIRMTPTIIVFKDGMKENIFKAGLDLLLPASLEDIQNAIDEAKKAGAF